MIFSCRTIGVLYDEKNEIQKLKRLGFTFKEYKHNQFIIAGMPEIEINSLEELINLSKELGSSLIVSEGLIEIEDDYRT